MLTRQRTEALVVHRPLHFAAQSARRTQMLHSKKPRTLEEQVGRVQRPGKNKPTWPKRASYGHGGGATHGAVNCGQWRKIGLVRDIARILVRRDRDSGKWVKSGAAG